MNFSIYTSAFNLENFPINFRDALINFSSFADEVCVATNDDFSFLSVFPFAQNFSNIRVIQAPFDREDPWFDGKLKNAALQCCSIGADPQERAYIGLDLDERIPLWQRPLWEKKAQELYESPNLDGFLVPSIDLWGDIDSMRWDAEHNIRKKWYLHKAGLFRGPVGFARLPNGKIDISLSDSCELLSELENGSLARAIPTYPAYTQIYPLTAKEYLDSIKNSLYVFHLGYLDLEKRASFNESFWKAQWERESGEKKELPTNTFELIKPTIKHELRLWND